MSEQEVRVKVIAGTSGKMVAARLLPGTDLMTGIARACEMAGVRQGTIVSAIGSLRQATVQVLMPSTNKIGAAYGAPVVITDFPIEVLALQGTICQTDEGGTALHMHVVLSDLNGRLRGGHLVPGGNPVLATIDLIVLEATEVRFGRRYDPETELPMFSPEESCE